MVERQPIFGGAEATFIPGERPALFLWSHPSGKTILGEEHAGVLEQRRLTVPGSWSKKKSRDQLVVTPVDGLSVPLEDILPPLITMPLGGTSRQCVTRSVSAWSAVAKLAVELVAGQQVVPWVEENDESPRARWRAALRPEDRRRAEALARASPPAGRAWPGSPGRRIRPRLMAAWHSVRSFLDESTDILVRDHVSARSANAWTARFAVALGPSAKEFSTISAVEGRIPELVRQWVAPGVGEIEETPVRLGLRLGLPEDGDGMVWPLKLVVEATSDPSLRAEAGEMWKSETDQADALATMVPNLHEAFLLELDRACRLWEPLAPCLDEASPEGVILEPERVVELVGEAAPLLLSAGFGLHVPPELSVSGRRRLRARLRGRSSSGAGEASGLFGLETVLTVCWEAALGDEQLSVEELRSLAEAKRPLVRWRDQWLVVDQAELKGILALLERPPEELEGVAALRAVISGDVEGADGAVGKLHLDSDDELLGIIDELRTGGRRSVDRVPGFDGLLRPYQAVGAAWLGQLGRLGLGACLADDMGLGKTMQVIAHLLLRRAASELDVPSLVVTPTSVLGNWKRELERFAPKLDVHLHHGPDRIADTEELCRQAGSGVVVTSYGVLRSDASLLTSIAWDVAVLDEAQFIKNHQAKVARAAFGLRARHRIALTGTPVENRLTDLWSIFAFINPGLLGGVTRFKTQLAKPIERFRDPQAVEKLQRLTSPFLLRRKKTDPGIAPELPPRIVLRSSCSLTREQASLYQASLDSMMAEVESSDGMNRRGKVLALIAALKQICNHPAQFLRERDGDLGRSGKLRRLAEELEVVFAEGEAVLLFTQYRTMGEILVRFLEQRFAVNAPFLHGGVTRAKREAMVARFQEEDGPPAMVVSVKAGGTGINLTRASHVVHVDRWWNPAVEAQATDRAHRIGQKRTVVVHTLVTAGTLEEKIDKMLEEKADLAQVALSGGERWLTELDDDALRELVALDPRAVDNDPDDRETGTS
ncbi:MAG: DEAD/DEAH box helicase [Thermoanaerobaculales bacterium]